MMSFIFSWFSSGIRIALPLLLAGMGVLISARSGVVNMSMEGNLLFGAFASVWVTYLTGSPLLGQMAGISAGVIYALFLAFFIIVCRGNHAVCGIGMNFVGQGLTTVLLGTVFSASAYSPNVTPVMSVNLPILGKQTVNLFYTIALVLLLWFLLYRTNFGLRLRAVGENPTTADSMGISVMKYRLVALVLAGAFGGLAGSELALGQMGVFAKLMTASKGFIAYSAVIFGGYSVFGTVLSTLALGLLDALQMRIQLFTNVIPGQFLLMLPYLSTLIAMVFFGNIRKPAALGKPYERGKF